MAAMDGDAGRVVQPIFVCGYGRSGTTLAVRLLAGHPDVAWFSGWTNRFPSVPQLALASRLQRWPAFERATRDLRRLPRPAEAYSIWDRHFPGFSSADRDWGAEDLPEGAVEGFRELVAAHLRYQGGERFVTKYTGWPRFDFVRGLFPNARFVFCRRDPRAVIYSAMRQRWGYKKRPDELAAMPWRERLDVYIDWYLRLDAALGRFEPGRDYVSLSYESLVVDPVSAIRSVCVELGLRWTSSFERLVAGWPVRAGADRAWRTNLSREERSHLEERLAAGTAVEA